jgi:LysR family hydrogen peroxide-inducible transcriptional activator
MRLLLLEEGHCFRDQALALCNLAPADAGDLMEGSSLSTLVQMAGAGIGVTLIPQMAVPIETRSAPVSVARLPATRATLPGPPAGVGEGGSDHRPARRIGMVWRRTNPLGPQLLHIARLVGEAGSAQDCSALLA